MFKLTFLIKILDDLLILLNSKYQIEEFVSISINQIWIPLWFTNEFSKSMK